MSWEQVAGLLAQATGDRAYLVGDASGIGKPVGDVEREARVDRELLAAGILPGDPSLFPEDATPPPGSDAATIATTTAGTPAGTTASTTTTAVDDGGGT
jgi:hypothetical protein